MCVQYLINFVVNTYRSNRSTLWQKYTSSCGTFAEQKALLSTYANMSICYLTTPFSFLQLFMCSEFFSFSPCITRRQNFYFLPRLSNQENSVLQGNKVSYSIESWKWGIFRQRQLFCNRKISSVLGCPAFSTGFPHSTVCSPSGRGGHFCPSTSLWLISGQKCPPLPSWQHTVSWGKPVLHAGPPTTFSFSPCSRAFSLSTYTTFP